MDEKEDTTIYKVVVNHEEDGRGRTKAQRLDQRRNAAARWRREQVT